MSSNKQIMTSSFVELALCEDVGIGTCCLEQECSKGNK